MEKIVLLCDICGEADAMEVTVRISKEGVLGVGDLCPTHRAPLEEVRKHLADARDLGLGSRRKSEVLTFNQFEALDKE